MSSPAQSSERPPAPWPTLLLLLLTWLSAAGCFDIAGYDDFRFQEPLRGRLEQSSIEAIDLLFVIDNSRGMTDKHEILRETLEAFVGRLVNPRCVDVETGAPTSQPQSPSDTCPLGERRELEPIRDLHIGIITTSLGGQGADACTGVVSPSENDRAHLLDRVVDGSAERVPTYEGLGFLAWDPNQQKTPPGENDVGDLVDHLSAIVAGIGERGCGYESILEAWYRFLVDPEPHLEVVVDAAGSAHPVGTDDTVLTQRRAFLRPDSLLAIVMISDENDCSTRVGGNFHLARQVMQPGKPSPYHLPPPRAACAIDPNDPCCRSCGQEPGDGCDTSGDACDGAPLSTLEDNINLRCFDQKRRFGIDFLYPIDRYVTGLTSSRVPNRVGELVPNPLLADRPASRVVLTGILGVPWQDIARKQGDGTPDLRDGLDVLGNPVGGVMNGSELLRPVGAFDDTWSIILGDPAAGTPPGDPLMIESIEPRSGSHPLTGAPLTPPGSSEPNPINGGEYTIAYRDDLQHACFFKGKDCAGSLDPACKVGRGQRCDPTEDACREGLLCVPDDEQCAELCDGGGECHCSEQDPLCQNAAGSYTLYQYAEAAYPGLRLLETIKKAGNQGVVASICPAQVDDASRPDFGFTPALEGAVVERLKGSLREHLCLDRSLLPNPRGFVDCVLIEARTDDQGEACRAACSSAGRRPATDVHQDVVALAADDKDRRCFCEIEQVSSDADAVACQSYLSEPVVNAFGLPVDAWCFVDALSEPRVGAPELTAGCPNDRRRIIRLAGATQQAPGSLLYLYCN